MDKHEAYEIEEILYNMRSRGIDVDRLLEVLTPMFDNEREKEFRSLRNLKYSRGDYSPRRVLSQCLQINKAPSLLQEALDEELYLNNEVNDIMHALELLDQTDDELLEFAKQLKDLKKRRRKVKDFVASVRPLADFVESNKTFVKNFNKVFQETNLVYERLDTRQYAPRVQTTLEAAFQKANKKEEIKI